MGAAKRKRTEDYKKEKARAMLNLESSIRTAEYNFDKLIREGVIVAEPIKVERIEL